MAFISFTNPLPLLRHTTPPSTHKTITTPLCSAQPRTATPNSNFTRRAFLTTLASAAASLVAATTNANAASPTPTITPSSLEYTIVKSANGPAPQIGDLVGIRFKGAYNGVVFDNLFEETTPYFYRVGSEAILKGIDEAVQLMKVGDVYDLTIPGNLAFGSKGRRASAGKPSIPPNATVSYTLELASIPGREPELLELLN